MDRWISVIVPCFDAAETLDACIDGLLEQRVPGFNLEWIVVDNNSRDGTAAIARQHASVKLLHEPKQGAYAARNAGLRVAKGQIVVFIDPDCVPGPDWLQRLTEPLHAGAVKICNGRSLLAGRSLVLRTFQDYEHVKDGLILGGRDPELFYGHTNNMAVRREVFDRLGFFEDRRRGGDVVLVRKTVDHFGCEAVEYVPKAEVVHLEMSNLRTYLKKVFLYGWSNALYSQLIPATVVSPQRRWVLYRQVCRECRYAMPRQLLLLVLMGVEGFAWRLGSRRGRSPSAGEPDQ
ncbi:MAG: glycosyltransferase family A protein [Myxococcota bacterium]|nr:glycosyltransferase family A protein [Myxococcota bacterium]